MYFTRLNGQNSCKNNFLKKINIINYTNINSYTLQYNTTYIHVTHLNTNIVKLFFLKNSTKISYGSITTLKKNLIKLATVQPFLIKNYEYSYVYFFSKIFKYRSKFYRLEKRWFDNLEYYDDVPYINFIKFKFIKANKQRFLQKNNFLNFWRRRWRNRTFFVSKSSNLQWNFFKLINIIRYVNIFTKRGLRPCIHKIFKKTGKISQNTNIIKRLYQ